MKIFLSHSYGDSEHLKKFRDNIVKTLRESIDIGGSQQSELFVDTSTDIGPGETLRKKIRESIKKCNVFVALWTPDTAASDWVQYEMAMADALNKRLVIFADPLAPKLPSPIENYELIALKQDVTANLRICGELLDQVPKQSEKFKHRIFIGSSPEGIEIARVIQSELHHDYSVEIWNQNSVFELGTATIEALETAVESYDFGIFVFAPDDEIIMRNTQHKVSRVNVIFELGLFIGKLGRLRVFTVHPHGTGIQIPSDLKGISIASYNPESVNVDAALGPVCQQIRLAIKAAAIK